MKKWVIVAAILIMPALSYAADKDARLAELEQQFQQAAEQKQVLQQKIAELDQELLMLKGAHNERARFLKEQVKEQKQTK